MSSGQEMWIVAVFFWIVCGIIGAGIGAQKNSSMQGFFAGLLLGPLGLLVAFALDNREKCPKCQHRLDEGVRMCGVCREPIAWAHGFVQHSELSPEALALLERKQQEDRQRELQRERDRMARVEEQAQRDREAIALFWKQVWLRLVTIVRKGAGVVSGIVRAIDSFFDALSDGSAAIKITYWLVAFGVIPSTILALIILMSIQQNPNQVVPDDAGQRPAAVDAVDGVGE